MHYGRGRQDGTKTLRADLDKLKIPAAPRARAAVSVVMPVRNALPYVDESIASILGQSHADFELVIGNDGSTDGSTHKLRDWAARDSRIRLFERESGSGPVRSSNWVVDKAEGELIARMDADDIAHPDRLCRQIALLGRRPDAPLVASLSVGIDCQGRRVREPDRWMLSRRGFGAPFAHGSILFRREAFVRAGGYRQECEYWEDQDFYLRMAALGPILVLPEALYHYRYAETSTRLTSAEKRVERAIDLMLLCQHHYRDGGDYGPLLAGGLRADPEKRINPEVYRSLASGPVWAGRPPRMLARMWRRGAFSLDRTTLMSWIFVLWGSVSPKTLRLVLRHRLRAKNRLAAAIFPDGGAYEWRCRGIAAAAASDAASPPDSLYEPPARAARSSAGEV